MNSKFCNTELGKALCGIEISIDKMLILNL